MPQRRRHRATTILRALGLALALVLLAACDHPWAASSAATPSPHSTVTTGTPVTLGTGGWQHIALPTPIQDIEGYTVSPTNPNTLYACSDEPDPLTLWRTTDAGAHWTNLDALGGPGTACEFSFAPDDPQHMGVQITKRQEKNHVCAGDTFYLSADGGATLRRLPAISLNIPASAPYDICTLAVGHAHLYLAFSSSDPGTPDSLLARSDDDGQTWKRIDGGLGDRALFFPPAIGPDNHLATTVEHFYPRPGQATTSLWTSSDAGSTWSKTSDLPGYPGPFLLTSFSLEGPTWPTANRPLYVLATEQIPSILYRESVLASADGVHWSQLPNLPVPGVSNERHGILQVLAALPDGRLAVWGADPQTGLSNDASQLEPQTHFSLWLWDPQSEAWQAVSTSLDVTANEDCGLCWQGNASTSIGGATYLYVSSLDAVIPSQAPVGLYRLRIPAA